MRSWIPSLPRPGRAVFGVLLAFGVNCLHVDLIGGAEFFFGRLIVLPFVLVLPPIWAVLAAMLASAPALLVHGVPFVVVLAGLEAFWLTKLAPRGWSVILSDLIYWLVVGIPAGLGLYARVTHVPFDQAVVILVNQALNALLAVVFGQFIIRTTRFNAWLGIAAAGSNGIRTLIFDAAFALVAVPLIAVAIGASLLLERAFAVREALHFRQAVAEVSRQLDLHLRSNRSAIVTAANVIEQGAANPAVLLEETRRTHNALETMLVTDRAGRVRMMAPTIPALMGSDVSDREYFKRARDTGAPVVSGVFRGRGFGSDVLVAVSAPMKAADGSFAGIVEGSLEVRRLGAELSRSSLPTDVSVAVIDSTGHVIIADRGTTLRPLDHVNRTVFGPMLAANRPAKPVPVTLFTADGTFEEAHATFGPGTFGLTVIGVRRNSAGFEEIFAVYLLLATIITGMLGLAVWLARIASESLAQPLEHFARDAVDQAESGDVAEIAPPNGAVPREIAMVFAAFNCLAARVLESYAALRKSNAELDARVAARTKELQAAQERAEAASRSKTDFVAMTGHEIRTPLNAIIGMADAVVEDLPPGPTADRVHTIHRAGVRLLGVVNDLLDLSKVEAGKLDLQLKPAEIGTVASEPLLLLRSLAQQQNLTLDLDIGPRLPLWLEIDAPRLQQVLVNLIGNALKFTRTGGVRLKIEEIAATPAEVTLRFAVVDTGPGISEEEQARLFQPYVQLAGAASARAAGSGLGLSISRRLVELFGGALTVRSAPGEGSEFHFTATFRRASAPALAVAPSVDRSDLAGLRVLIADDNIANQEVLRAFLEPNCSAVETVGSARDALSCLGRERFDLALIDLEMPDESGAIVAQTMAQHGRSFASAECVLVAVSAHNRDEKLSECLAQGFADYLPKPVSRQELYGTIRRLTAKRSASAAV